MLDIPCVIFAGGKSSRMGEDKALLPFAGFNTLTEFQLFRLKKIFKTVYISCKDKSKFDLKANFIEDIKNDTNFAPTYGFIAIFKELEEEKFFAFSVDTPFVSEKEISQIINADTSDMDVTLAKTNHGMHPMCAVYHRSLLNSFEAMLKNNNHKLGLLIRNSNATYVNFQNEKIFLNLNHPHEYKEALTLI